MFSQYIYVCINTCLCAYLDSDDFVWRHQIQCQILKFLTISNPISVVWAPPLSLSPLSRKKCCLESPILVFHTVIIELPSLMNLTKWWVAFTTMHTCSPMCNIIYEHFLACNSYAWPLNKYLCDCRQSSWKWTLRPWKKNTKLFYQIELEKLSIYNLCKSKLSNLR